MALDLLIENGTVVDGSGMPRYRADVGDPDNEPWFSVASIWEAAIKYGRGRNDFEIDPRLLRRGLLDNGYRELVVTGEHAIAVAGLPLLHRDPFDRILVAQSIVEGVVLPTADPVIAQYPAPVRQVIVGRRYLSVFQMSWRSFQLPPSFCQTTAYLTAPF